MHTWGIELEDAFLLFAVSYPLALMFIVRHHHRRFGRFSGWPAFLTTATFLYVCGIIAFVLFPLPEVTDHFCSLREDIAYWSLVPLSSFAALSDVYQRLGIPSVLLSGTFLQLFFNVVLMMPLGMLLVYRYKKSFITTVAIGFGVSLLIEITQGTAIFGIFGCPYRVAEVDDLITNTAGTALGFLMGRLLAPYLPNPDPLK